jgi:hypothetical protein
MMLTHAPKFCVPVPIRAARRRARSHVKHPHGINKDRCQKVDKPTGGHSTAFGCATSQRSHFPLEYFR